MLTFSFKLQSITFYLTEKQKCLKGSVINLQVLKIFMKFRLQVVINIR